MSARSCQRSRKLQIIPGYNSLHGLLVEVQGNLDDEDLLNSEITGEISTTDDEAYDYYE
jgi:hypothetical protein